MKKKLIAIALILCLTFTMAACGGGTEEAADSEEEPLKVALVMTGPITDGGWCASAYDALTRIEKDYGAEITYQENVEISENEEVFRNLAEAGYNLIIGHGYTFGDAAMVVAKEYPDVKFVVTSTDISQEPNVASINNDNIQQGFLAGAFAAMMTKTGVVGAVGGMDIPSIQAFELGFVNGAKYIDPNVEAKMVYSGDFTDVAAAKESALALIDAGADIVAHDADNAGLGVFQACQERGVYAMGAITDQYELAKDVVITSALSNLGEAIYVFVGNIDSFEPTCSLMGIKEGCVGLAPFHDFEGDVPDEVKDRIAQIEEDVASGKIDVTK